MSNDDLIFCSVVHHLVVYIHQKNCNHFGQENRADKSPILLDFFFLEILDIEKISASMSTSAIIQFSDENPD